MLTGKTALITGGSRGIGGAIVKKLSSLGANIALVYSGSGSAATAVAEECAGRYGVTVRTYKCNVASFEEAKQTVAAVKRDFGTVHILVNNAGVTKDGLIAMMPESAFDDVIDVNLKGAFHMIRHCAPLMIRARGGQIVNISSVSGIMGNPGQANYSASKAGLIGLTKSVARELASRNIRCNAVAPGFIATRMTEDLTESPLAGSIPLGRMGKPEEVAEAVAFLVCSEYITGEVLRVDGGIAI